MENVDRRIRGTQKSLHDALISLVFEKNYDSITVQEILDRADVGRAKFYAHFKGKDELLISGARDLQPGGRFYLLDFEVSPSGHGLFNLASLAESVG
jgi:hypothetical protein